MKLCFKVSVEKNDGHLSTVPLRANNERDVRQKAKHLQDVKAVGTVEEITFEEYETMKGGKRPFATQTAGPRVQRPAPQSGYRPFADLKIKDDGTRK